MVSFVVRRAGLEDVTDIKLIADANRDALGFVPRARVKEAVASKRIMIAIVSGETVGFAIFRHRKTDRQTTLSDICVVKSWRGKGVGRKLIAALYEECVVLGRSFLQLKCPEGLSANDFYEQIGFCLIQVEKGRTRRLKVWRLDIDGAEAV